MDKNGEIYQKLHSKCWDGTAITYIRMAAEFDGHGAGKALKDRYNKRSPQQLESYKKLAKEHRHVSGTSMPAHIVLIQRELDKGPFVVCVLRSSLETRLKECLQLTDPIH